MSSHKEYLDFIMGQFPQTGEVSYKPMMGEYLLYFRGKLFGEIYDDRFLIKPSDRVGEYLREIIYETPYDGAKKMLLVDDVDDKNYLAGLLSVFIGE